MFVAVKVSKHPFMELRGKLGMYVEVAVSVVQPIAEESPRLGRQPHRALSTISDALGVQGVRMTYAHNEEIFGEGEPADCVYRVLSGVARTCRILADGRRQIGEFFLAGDVFGIEA